MTVLHDEALEAGVARADLVTALHDAAALVAVNPGTLMPEVRLTYRIPPGPRAMRVEALAAIAEMLGADVVRGNGMSYTERRIGRNVIAEAHLPDDDHAPEDAFDDLLATVSGWARNWAPRSAA